MMQRCLSPRGVVAILSVMAAVGVAAACGDPLVSQALRDVLSDRPEARAEAIRTLREAGPDGLAMLLATHSAQIAECYGAAPSEMAQRLRDALDGVAMARDTHAAGLYWHTDLAAAEAYAAATQRPILSLRMLGRLNEDFSCANSRFFRTALYANEEIGEYLRANYVLHWQSVRPAPRVTIDFGDGRVMERTLTGNSAHYVLTPDGRVVDVFPGLYGPEAFKRMLTEAYEGARAIMSGSLTPQQHQARILAQLEQNLLEDLAAVQPTPVSPPAPPRDANQPDGVAAELVTMGKRMAEIEIAEAVVLPAPRAPDATEAGRIAFAKDRAERIVAVGAAPVQTFTIDLQPTGVAPAADEAGALTATKFAAESGLLTARAPAGRPPLRLRGASPLDARIDALDDAAWAQLAARHPTRLDAGSRRLMASKLSSMGTDDPMWQKHSAGRAWRLARVASRFEESMAIDTARNDYAIRRVILGALARDAESPDVDELNSRIYAELFLTPDSDPWLGLLPDDVYVALDNDGLCAAPTRSLAPPAFSRGE